MKKKIGLLTVALLASLVVPSFAKADLANTGAESGDATVKTIEDEDRYSVTITWGSLEYTYTKMGTDSYHWTPNTSSDEFGSGQGYTTGNYVAIKNNSNMAINASLSWTPAISGVNGTFSNTKYTEGKGTCINASGILDMDNRLWSNSGKTGNYGGIDTTARRNNRLYSDSSCNTPLTTSEVYDSSKTYYVVSLTRTTIENASTTTISSPVSSNDAPFTVVGFVSQNPAVYPTYLATTAKFWLELNGGNITDVESAFNGNKKIGTVTVTIDSQE